jgi:hypothetical protein
MAKDRSCNKGSPWRCLAGNLRTHLIAVVAIFGPAVRRACGRRTAGFNRSRLKLNLLLAFHVVRGVTTPQGPIAPSALIKSIIANVHGAIQYVRRAAEQLPKIDRWTALLGYICQRIVGQAALPTPPPAITG